MAPRDFAVKIKNQDLAITQVTMFISLLFLNPNHNEVQTGFSQQIFHEEHIA